MSDQLPLDAWRPLRFDGADYQPSRDNARLGAQLSRIYRFMLDGQWHTLDEIAQATNDPPASISAQLRHLRKPRFGGHQVDREHVGNGVYRYRVTWRAVARAEDR